MVFQLKVRLESGMAAGSEQRLLEAAVVGPQDCWVTRLDVQRHRPTACAGESLASSGSPTSHDRLALRHHAIRVGNGLENAAQPHSYPCPVIDRVDPLLAAAAI